MGSICRTVAADRRRIRRRQNAGNGGVTGVLGQLLTSDRELASSNTTLQSHERATPLTSHSAEYIPITRIRLFFKPTVHHTGATNPALQPSNPIPIQKHPKQKNYQPQQPTANGQEPTTNIQQTNNAHDNPTTTTIPSLRNLTMADPAPWAPLLHTHLTHLTPPTFTLSTLHHTPSLTPPYSPRARTCVFRGMFASGPRGAAKGPQTATSDLLTFTTDVRSAKVPDLLGPGQGDRRASGGGGRVELVFWVKEVNMQWRIRGDGWVLGPDVGGEGEGVEAVKSALKGRLREVGEGWGWEGEWERQFEVMGRELKKGLAGPPPGEVSKVAGGEFDEEKAKGNFRLVVVRPGEVECVDLTDPESSKRWIYTFVEGEWKREELNP
ncbi:hypothetical protein GMDG_07671 [Pseudogymnoascus destructans 20631-21]|uniref:Pyridoxamine 5'-phosphate oxidase Alr4036 family FMN-binding domain-containing protein n=2 Tax=Pseudogymnoascus destructans TaxID=655981 RepID=L8FZJ5_PSED2|nr:hypothetical protein GMDG_07671 [Pseudogymnoascus destructans 20631-21]